MHDGECPHLPSSSAAFLASHIQSLSPSHLACTDCGASSTDLWLCLSESCGHIGCGRTSSAHAVSHHASSGHPVVAHTSNRLAWCYDCDRDLALWDTDAPLDGAEPLCQSLDALYSTPASVPLKRTPPPPDAGRGIVGLENLGNTCYLNAALQALMAVEPLSSHFVGAPPGMAGLAGAFRQLYVSAAREGASTVAPSDLVREVKVRNAQFRGFSQQDAHELLRFVLDATHEELKEKREEGAAEKSIVSDTFGGSLASKVTCQECLKESVVVEPFFDLSLPIDRSPSPPLTRRRGWSTLARDFFSSAFSYVGLSSPASKDGSLSLNDCLSSFFSPERLTGADAVLCEHCRRCTESVKRFSLDSLPQVLCLQLKRFRHTKYAMSAQKVFSQVRFPTSGLDLSEYCRDGEKTADTLYDLVAVVNHHGSLACGHYTACAMRTEQQKWFKFDDRRVTQESPENVAKTEAYLLFYRRRAPEDIVRLRETTWASIDDSSSGHVYISSRWMTAFAHVVAPGPLLRGDVAMRTPEDMSTWVSVSRDAYRALIGRFGGPPARAKRLVEGQRQAADESAEEVQMPDGVAGRKKSGKKASKKNKKKKKGQA